MIHQHWITSSPNRLGFEGLALARRVWAVGDQSWFPIIMDGGWGMGMGMVIVSIVMVKIMMMVLVTGDGNGDGDGDGRWRW